MTKDRLVEKRSTLGGNLLYLTLKIPVEIRVSICLFSKHNRPSSKILQKSITPRVHRPLDLSRVFWFTVVDYIKYKKMKIKI